MNIRAYLTILSFAIVATACGGNSNGPTSAGSAPATTTTSVSNLPEPGNWTGTAGFGTFELTVNSTSTAVSRIAYNFQNWRCGGVTHSGGVTISSSSGWSITNRQFSIQNNIDPNFSMSVQGSFSSSTSGSGSWSANSMGTTCSGTWTASK